MSEKKIHSYADYVALVEEIIEHDKRYYLECKPIISDYEYDQLMKEIEKYEKAHPDKIVLDSPTQRVSELPSKGFSQAKHNVPMLSLANTYSQEEVSDFIARVHKLLHKKEMVFCVELKMDGTALSVRYEKGRFVRAVTRGNGWVGDDVTQNVKTIKSLPLHLEGKDVPDVLEVRGEVFMHKRTFQAINKKREEDGLEVWANPRNAAAGSLKLLDSKEVAKRHLDIVFYGIAENIQEITSQFSVHQFLKKWGLPVSKERHFTQCRHLEEIFHFAKKVQEERKELSFEIDGIVIKLDDLSAWKTLGATGKSPRYAVAYKFTPEQAETVIESITVQVGRTGVLTPVAELKPVFLAGSTISRATLHNQDEVHRKDIRVGDTVIIEKGGDVIPKVVSVDLKKRLKKTEVWQMPKTCPICHTHVVHKAGEVAIRCPNPKCVARKERKIAFFASKGAMDIDHLGEKNVEKLVREGIISRISDIYLLNEESLSQLEGFKEKSINNLLESIQRSKQCTLARFILALEIPYVGKETAELIADYIQDIRKLFTVSREELMEIEGIGEKVADSVAAYRDDPTNQEEIHLLLSHGVTPQKVVHKKISKEHPFYGKTFVLTGTLDRFSRDEASRLIKEKGGKTSSSVSAQTDYVLVGQEPGSKYDKAVKLGIKILEEKEFIRLLE
ncbi:MAG: NAD-dependent DNA ligase LigA [Parachlamydiales bacterium]|nr:NAD-dependent DNA ligase LigA [Parachlamydiales bacterium]